MLARFSVREPLHFGTRSKRDDCRSSYYARRPLAPPTLGIYCAANALPFVEVELQLKRSRRRAGPCPSAFSSDGGNLLTSREEKSRSDQCGPFSRLSILPAGSNCRQIVVAIAVDAPLSALWSVLTDYEGLPDFIPGLAVCKVEDRWENGARLFQIGEQNLALGLKFKAKGVINVKENPIEVLSSSVCRRIDFEMIEGDFQIFKGCWQMEQVQNGCIESAGSESGATLSKTILTYMVDVQPKAWVPVRLVEGILSKEIQSNLLCVRDQVLRIKSLSSSVS